MRYVVLVGLLAVVGCQEATQGKPDTAKAKASPVVQDNSEAVDTVYVEQEYVRNQLATESEYANKSRRYNAYVMGVAKDSYGKVHLRVFSFHDPRIVLAYVKDPSSVLKLPAPTHVTFRGVAVFKDGKLSFKDVINVKVDKSNVIELDENDQPKKKKKK